MSHTRSLAALVLLLALTLFASVACSGMRAQARSSGGSGSSKECASCKRMCEVAGDAQENPGAIDECKADCNKKCS